MDESFRIITKAFGKEREGRREGDRECWVCVCRWWVGMRAREGEVNECMYVCSMSAC